MQEFRWMNWIGSLDKGIELINELYWNISFKEENNRWYVYGGEKVIFVADSHEACEAFLYGLSLAYAVIPEQVLSKLKEGLKEWYE